MISLTEDKRMLGYGLLNRYPNISHFVTARHDGYSGGAYASFNCSPYSGDNLEHVRRNQQLLVEGMKHKPIELVIPRQVHDTYCRVIGKDYLATSPEMKRDMLEGIDALISDEPGYCLCISTADCVPVLVYDSRHCAVAAIHAGWRGTVKRIVLRTLAEMKEKFGTQGEDVVACIGPSISPASFEVGEEVYESFRKEDFDMPCISFRNKETGKYHIDLWEANRRQLLEFGVLATQIEVAGICTYQHAEDFFSARRLGINSGRILSGIMIAE